MKKIISILIAILVGASISLTAFAAETEEEGSLSDRFALRQQRIEERQEKIAQKRAEFQAIREQRAAAREELAGLREGMRQNSRANLEENKEINTLRKEIATRLRAIKAEGGTLSEAQLTEIKNLNAEAKEIHQALKDLRVDLRTLAEENRENIEAKDYAAAESVLLEISELQEQRGQQLSELKAVLEQILSVITG